MFSTLPHDTDNSRQWVMYDDEPIGQIERAPSGAWFALDLNGDRVFPFAKAKEKACETVHVAHLRKSR